MLVSKRIVVKDGVHSHSCRRYSVDQGADTWSSASILSWAFFYDGPKNDGRHDGRFLAAVATDIAVRWQSRHTATGIDVSYGITQCYLPPGRGDIPAFTTAKAGTRFSDPGWIQGWVELVGWLRTVMVYPPKEGHGSPIPVLTGPP